MSIPVSARPSEQKQVRLLIVDDDPVTRELLKGILSADGYSVDLADNGQSALELANQTEFAVVLSDVQMSPVDGHALLSVLRERGSQAVPVLMTGFGTLQGAVSAIHNGAFDYLSKPFRPDLIRQVVRRAVGHWNAQQKDSSPSNVPATELPMLIGRSPKMVEVYRLLALASLNDSNVLISGESGTGKELVARAIYQYSARKDAPFIAVNCAALSDTLLESELFGHMRGSFTGAIANKRGLFDEADTGTLFLDEIGDISPAMQVKLLRVLQNGEIKPVGSNENRRVNVRVLAATHRDLEQAVSEGKFREDLYYRLKVLRISIPPLSERAEDLEALVKFFIQKHTQGKGRGQVTVSPEALDMLRLRSWPGNVRELEHAVQHALAMTQGRLLYPEDFPETTRLSAPEAAAPLVPSAPQSLDEVERDHIAKVLASVDFNKSRAAEVLGIDRATLYRKAQKYSLSLGPTESEAIKH
ncbi:sigma-54 dependent transcriptional regulator [bacterium]|nr:sigma-54 dependent transcriptional regulator [bacterium]